jgi:hypothetical protein
MVDPSRSVDGGFGFLTDLVGIQMRNIEAVGQAQQKILEGIGVLAQRQTEIIEETWRRSVSEPAPLGSPDIRGAVGQQIETLKTTILENQANSNILSEIAARSSAEVANILQLRMMAALDEFKAALEHAMPQTRPAAGSAAPAAAAIQPTAVSAG